MINKRIRNRVEKITELRNSNFTRPARYFNAVSRNFKPIQQGEASSLNFFDYTIVKFTETEKPDREPDFVSGSGSCYWYSPEGVVRGSNHWGNGVANCDWALKLKNGRTIYGITSRSTKNFREDKFAYAPWKDFILKSRIFEINGEEVLTTFNNSIGRDQVIIDGRLYRRRIIEVWDDVTDQQ